MAESPRNARGVAYDLLRAVEVDGAYANLLMPKLLDKARLDSRDSGFAQELAFGTLRNALFYDFIIAKCAGRDIQQIDADARLVLELGSHQLLGMRVPSHAALSETVDLAKKVLKASLSGFINGVLRRVSEKSRDEWLGILHKQTSNQITRFSVEYSQPEWMVRAVAEALRLDGLENDLEALLAANNQAPLVNLVALPGLATAEDLYQEGAILGGASPIGAELPDGDPAMLRSVKEGTVRVQDQGSQLAALALLSAQTLTQSETEDWLDLCAGPGGKAAVLAASAKQQNAQLVCNEVLPHRAKLVSQALSKVNPNVYVRTGDGRDLGADAPEAFDRILLDAPCTGLGALRRRPESRYRKQQSDVAQLARLQEELFESAWLGLKPGGVLAYVTCSPHPAETTAVISWAQKKFSNLELLDATNTLQQINPALKTDAHLALNSKRKTVQLWPHRQNTDAMFIALVRKNKI